jgi:DNA repair exonuclease SbcCD ATPase subunit
MCIIKRYLGQATRPLCKGREEEEEEEEEEVEANYNISDFKEENRGQFFCFNCEGVGHVEFECPHPRIERNDTEEENSNEEEENHEEKIIQQEDENLKKLKHVEIENSKLKDTQRKLRSELGSCEKTVVILKKQLEDFEKLREETISLKTLLEEERRIGEVRNVQMIKKEEDCEKLEQEVVSLRKSLRNSQVPKDLTHLGCMGETSYKEDANTNKKVEERATQTVDEKWTRIPERRNDYKRDEYPRRPPTFRNQRTSISMKETTEE